MKLRIIEAQGQKYYRATAKLLGKKVMFNPEGYYEGIELDGSPKYQYETFFVSDVPETAASKYIGGAVLGASSMFRTHSKLKPNTKIYIYEITQPPDKDISNWRVQDFEYLQEVRYRKPVEGIYIGYVLLSKKLYDLFDNFYKLMSIQDDWVTGNEDSPDGEFKKEVEKVWKMTENGEFQKLLNSIKPI